MIELKWPPHSTTHVHTHIGITHINCSSNIHMSLFRNDHMYMRSRTTYYHHYIFSMLITCVPLKHTHTLMHGNATFTKYTYMHAIANCQKCIYLLSSMCGYFKITMPTLSTQHWIFAKKQSHFFLKKNKKMHVTWKQKETTKHFVMNLDAKHTMIFMIEKNDIIIL